MYIWNFRPTLCRLLQRFLKKISYLLLKFFSQNLSGSVEITLGLLSWEFTEPGLRNRNAPGFYLSQLSTRLYFSKLVRSIKHSWGGFEWPTVLCRISFWVDSDYMDSTLEGSSQWNNFSPFLPPHFKLRICIATKAIVEDVYWQDPIKISTLSELLSSFRLFLTWAHQKVLEIGYEQYVILWVNIFSSKETKIKKKP